MIHAKPQELVFACLRQSQQVSENAGKHPKSGFLLRLIKAIDKFK
jgi:hypothetical protein